VENGTVIEIPSWVSEDMIQNKAGAFVTIKKSGKLRGCIGTILPDKENVAAEIIYNAISAGTRDPRFNPIKKEEISDLVYSVDILREPENIDSLNELDVKRYGVIVKAGGRSGLLLPNLEGIDTVEEQVSIALEKAGIKFNEKYELQRFEVTRHR
jgi:AmmeMemoRadiSam system protein A